MSNVFEKLQTARVELQQRKLKKSGKNKYSGFEYFELSDFLPAINEIFLGQKLCSNFSIEEGVARLEIINAEKIDENTTFIMPTAELELKGCTAIQALGGVNTYCKRYLYLNALEIVENDLLDPQAGKIETPKRAVKKSFQATAQHDDSVLWDKIAACGTVEELNALWKAEHENAEDKETFKNLCASRKEVIIGGK